MARGHSSIRPSVACESDNEHKLLVKGCPWRRFSLKITVILHIFRSGYVFIPIQRNPLLAQTNTLYGTELAFLEQLSIYYLCFFSVLLCTSKPPNTRQISSTNLYYF